MLLANETPFVLDRFALFNKEGAETLVVLLKATFTLSPGAPPAIAPKQDPMVPCDVYAGEPDKSGILIEGDYVPPKPRAGVTLTGHAVATRPGVTEMNVGVRVGDASQSAVVFGNRKWDTIFGISRIVGPVPFERIPLTWENAFGGFDNSAEAEKNWEGQFDNPVGKGFLARKTGRPIAGTPLPNIEHIEHRMRGPKDRLTPVGFCPVAPSWHPRMQYAGTYDEAWKSERAPLLPDDFDDRFFLNAPPALTSTAEFGGGEQCVIVGTAQEGRLEFNLPTLRPGFRLRWATGAIQLLPKLDTVHVDTDEMKLHLVFRAASEVHGRIETLEAIEARLNKAP